MNTKAISLIYIIILISLSTVANAKDFYWIRGSGDWNNIERWSDQPGGGTNPWSEVPTYSDNVFFDENSFPDPGAEVIINDVARCANMDWSRVTNFPKLKSTNKPAHFLSIYGSLKLGKDMILDLLKPLYFSASTLNNKIDFAGHTFNEDIHFTKNGGWIVETPLHIQDHIIYFEQGNLSFEADITCAQIIADNPISRTLSFNNSNITLTKSGAFVLSINTENLKLNPGASKIITKGTNASIYTSGNNPINFNNVEFQANGSSIINESLLVDFNNVEFLAGGSLEGPNRFENLIFTQGNDYQIHSGFDQTVLGLWTAIGTCSEHINISGIGGSGSIIANSVTLEYLKIQNMIASGAAALFDAIKSFDLGGNTGWDITALTPQNYNWVGGTDNNWSTPSNWNPDCVPSRIDNVTIDGISNVKVDQNAECNNLTLSKNVNLSGSAKLSIFGSLNAGDATWALLGPTYFVGVATQTILINDSFKADVYFSGIEVQLASDLKIPKNSLHLESGLIDSKNYNLELNQFVSIGDNIRSLSLGTSTIRLNGNSLKTWDIEGSLFSVNNSEYLIELIKPTAGFYNNHFTTIEYNKVHFIDDREKANLTNDGALINFTEVHFIAGANISGDHNYDAFILSAGKTYLFATGSKQIISKNNGFIAHGSCSQFIYLKGNGGKSTIVSDVNSNQIEHIQITDLEVTDGAGDIKNPGLEAQSSFGIANYNGWHIVTKVLSENFQWIGTDDSDWFNPNNWDKKCVPTRIDNVFFDALKIPVTGSKTVSINGTRLPECNNMTWSNASALSFEGGSDLHIYGSLDFSTLKTGSFTYNGIIYFKSDGIVNGDVNITLDQVLLSNNVIFEGTRQEDDSWKAGTWNLDSHFETSGDIKLERGTFNSNDFSITCDELYSNFSDIRTLQLGASILNLNGILLTPKNLDFLAGTSEIIFGENGKVNVTSGVKAIKFHNVTFDKTSGTALLSINSKVVSFNEIDIKSNANFLYEGFDVENLILNQGKTYKFDEGIIYNIGDITAVGACEGTIDISSLSAGDKTTFNSKNGDPINVTQVNLIDVFATPAGTFMAKESIDLGNNDGWTFADTPIGRNLYWRGGTGNWDEPAHWAETVNGAPGTCVPTALDNVFFDINSFSGKNQIVSTGSGDIRCRTMDWTGSEGTSPIFQLGAIEISSVYIYGSLILNENLIIDLPDVDFYFRSTEKGNLLKLHNFDFPRNVTFDGINGEWTLYDNLDIEGDLILSSGHFISSGFNISCDYFESKDFSITGKQRTLDIRNSIFTIYGYNSNNGSAVFISTVEGSGMVTFTLVSDNSEIIIKRDKAFKIDGVMSAKYTFHSIRFDEEGSLRSQNVKIRINELTFEQGGEVTGTLDIGKLTLNKGTKPNTFEFESNVTFPIEEFNALGSCNFPIDIRGSKKGQQTKIEVKTSINANFIELTDINGLGSSVNYIANNSIEHTNVTNWTINAITAVDLYWVGNGLNDEWSNHLNWSKSSGGTSEGCVPTELDNVFFDSKSFLGSKIVIINTNARCHNITWTDDVDASSIFKVQNQLDVHGFLDFSENMTLEMSSDLKFKGDGLTIEKPIDFAGKALDGNIYFGGKDQSWILQNELSTTGDLFLDNGALDTKGYDMSLSSFSSSNPAPLDNRKLDISGSTITIVAEKYRSWNMIFLGSPLIFTAVNSELYFPKKGGIYCESASDVKFGDAVFDAYGEIDINGNGFEAGSGEFKTVIFRGQGQIMGDHTIYDLEFTLGYGDNTIQAGRTIKLTNDLTMEGVNCSYVHLRSDNPGLQAYINASKKQTIYHVSLENIKMSDVNAPHNVIGNYINVGNTSEGWLESIEDDYDSEPPSFKDILPKREEWCNSAASLEHVKSFPINDRTLFQWYFSLDDNVLDPYEKLDGETSATIVVTKSGFYKIELNYNNPSGGVPCILHSTIEVVMNPTSNMVIEFTTNNVQCYGESDGFIKASVTGGYAPYKFFWTDEADVTIPSSSEIGTDESQASNLTHGKYSVITRDIEGCVDTSYVDIFNAYEMFIHSIAKNDLNCFNVTDGEINIDASGGSGSLAYYMDGSLESANITGLSADEYLIHVQDGNDCKSDEESVEILSPEEITFDFITSEILCVGDKNGSIDPQIKGGIAPYIYKWTGSNGYSSASPIISDLEGATYTIEVTDVNNCIYTSPFELAEPEAIVLSEFKTTDANCFGETSGEIFVKAEKGTAPYKYTVNATTNKTGQFLNLAANAYSLLVTDNNACTKLKDFTIKEPIEMGLVVSDNISPTCNNLKDGIINIIPYGGNNDYNFAWSGPNDFRSYTKNNTGLDFGEYTLLLKDKKGCSLDSIIHLDKSAPLQLGLIIEEVVTSRGANDGSFRLEILGGTIPYTYTVDGPSGYSQFSPSFFNDDQALFENLVGGLYTVNITDESSCGSVTKDIMLPEGDLLVSQIFDQEDISCTGYNDGVLDGTAIGGNGTYSYTWSGPSGFTANTKSISALNPGTYTLTVQSSGQTATDQATIVEPLPLVTTTSLSNVACFNEPNGSIQLEVSGGTKPYSILWEGDRGLFSHADKIYDLAKGDYDYQVTDARACIVSNSVTISEPDVIFVSQTHTEITAMGLRDGTITATATGGTPPYTIFISGPKEYSKKDFNNTTGICFVDILEQGVYFIEVLDANDCRTIIETRIYEPEKMVVSLINKTTPICHGGDEGSIDVRVEGSDNYTTSWKADNHYKNENTLLINNLKAGNYTLTVTDNVTTEVITFEQEIKEPDLIEIEYGVDGISCLGLTNGYINIYPKGGTPNYTYKWEGVDPGRINLEDQGDLSSGSYTVQITDSRSCESEVYPFEVKEPELFSGSHSIKEPLCYGDKNGEVELEINSGATPYIVNWNTGAVSKNIYNLKFGTYSYTVIDNENCEFNGSVALTQPDTLIAEINLFNDIICYGQNDGEASATVTGGSVPYKFYWSNGETMQDISNLRPNEYKLIVTDKNECQDTASVVIEEPEELLLRVEANRPTIEGANDGEIFALAFGGTPAFSSTWEIETDAEMWSLLPETNLEISGLDRGKYKLELTDINSCSVDTIINLEYLYERVIEIPKAFTPNKDGYNDYWDILRIEYIQRLTIVIYDRLGTKVYTFSGTGNEYKGNPWTGTNKNYHLPIGSYYYAIEIDDSKPLTGSVTIAR